MPQLPRYGALDIAPKSYENGSGGAARAAGAAGGFFNFMDAGSRLPRECVHLSSSKAPRGPEAILSSFVLANERGCRQRGFGKTSTLAVTSLGRLVEWPFRSFAH